MYLTSIGVEGFRSFRDHNETGPLPPKGLGLIRGFNKDTGGSSGSGKSSLALAVAHAFRYSPFPGTALQSWNEDAKKMLVTLGLTLDDGRAATLKVGRENSLAVEGEGTVKGSAVAVQERLQQLTGLSADLLKATAYRPQGEPGQFLSMTDADKKEFLSVLLGLEELEALAESATKRANELQSQVDTKIAVIQSMKEQIATINVTPPFFANTSVLQADVVTLTAKVQEAKTAFDAAVVDCQAAQKEYQDQQELLKSNAKATLAALKQEQDVIRGNRPPFVPVAGEQVTSLTFAKATAQTQLQQLQQEEKEERSKRQKTVDEIQRLLDDTKRRLKERPQVQSELDRIKKEISTLESQHCPTCSQFWVDTEAALHLEKLRSKATDLATKLEELGKLQPSAEAMTMMLDKAKVERDNYRHPEIPAAQAALEAAADVLSKKTYEATVEETTWKQNRAVQDAELEKTYLKRSVELEQQIQEELVPYQNRIVSAGAVRDSCSKHYMALKEDLERDTKALAQAEAFNTQLQAVYESNLSTHERLQKSLVDAVADMERARAEAYAEADFASLVGREGFLGSIFEEVLLEIASEANELLRDLPNVSTVTIRFATENETKKGTVQRKIVPVLMKGTVAVPLKEGLSGGQRTSVELAVDLAVMKVIGSRTGKIPGWLILDESFEGHDVPVKEACLEILRRAAENRLILVVDHATEIKEMFDFTVDVESENDVSVIVR